MTPDDNAAPLRFRRSFVNYGLSSLITFPVALLTTFLVTPTLIRVMGLDDFGRFATYGVVFAVLGFGELGLPTAATRDTAVLVGRGELSGVYRLSRSYVLRALRTGGLVSLAGYVGLGVVVLTSPLTGLHLDGRQIGDLLVTFAAPTLSLPSGVLFGIAAGLQKQHLARYVSSALSVAAIPATLFVVQNFEPVRALLLLALGTTGLSAVALVLLLRHLLGEHWRAQDQPSVATISVREGVSMSAPSLASFFDNQLDKALLAATGQQALVGAFQLSTNLGNQLRGYALYPLSPLLPALSALRGSGRDAAADDMQDRFLGLTLTLGSVGAGVLIARPASFTELWLGSSSGAVGVVSSALPLALLGIWLNMQTSGPYLQALSSGRVAQLARIGFGTAAVNGVISVALVVPFGLTGVLVGTLVANLYNLGSYHPWRSRGLHAQAAVLLVATLGTRLWGSYSSVLSLVLLLVALVVVGMIVSVSLQSALRSWFVSSLRLARS